MFHGLFSESIIIPLAGMALGLVSLFIPVLLVWLVMDYRQRRALALYETVKQFAERGQPVPPELLDPPRKHQQSGDTPLFRAITLIGVGVGLAVMFWLLDLRFLIGIGALLGCIGLAQIIALRIERAPASSTERP